MSLLRFWALNVSIALLSMQSQKALGLYQKHLNLCYGDERRSYMFGRTWGWVNNDWILIFGWTIPLKSQSMSVKLNFSNDPWETSPVWLGLNLLMYFVGVPQVISRSCLLLTDEYFPSWFKTWPALARSRRSSDLYIRQGLKCWPHYIVMMSWVLRMRLCVRLPLISFVFWLQQSQVSGLSKFS